MESSNSIIETIIQLFSTLSESDQKMVKDKLAGFKEFIKKDQPRTVSCCPHCHSTHFVKNGNGKVGYTQTALTEEVPATLKTEVDNMDSKNRTQSKETFGRAKTHWRRMELNNEKNAVAFLTKIIMEVEDEKTIIEILNKMGKEKLNELTNTVKQNPQNIEFQEGYNNLQQKFKEQLSLKQENEMGINQNFRQENESNKFNTKKLGF
ncbi:hypothetical protein B0187_09085 [Haemophilus paracuniculus]|uniref:Uncharacterized protein n=1 Tax=Haemophilus paracuniculus TaxID=734 RepID=A0A1T0AQ31_9PAST|nr:hypothetical protein [Haemophilus paracuniculus]OOR98234.1 hypothetical protein B0187_09085 [Haemophilus paracuniculus]